MSGGLAAKKIIEGIVSSNRHKEEIEIWKKHGPIDQVVEKPTVVIETKAPPIQAKNVENTIEKKRKRGHGSFGSRVLDDLVDVAGAHDDVDEKKHQEKKSKKKKKKKSKKSKKKKKSSSSSSSSSSSN
jgi:hypothetical protein